MSKYEARHLTYALTNRCAHSPNKHTQAHTHGGNLWLTRQIEIFLRDKQSLFDLDRYRSRTLTDFHSQITFESQRLCTCSAVGATVNTSQTERDVIFYQTYLFMYKTNRRLKQPAYCVLVHGSLEKQFRITSVQCPQKKFSICII